MISTTLRCAAPAFSLLALLGNCVHLFDRGHELDYPERDDNMETLQKMEESILGALTSGDFKSLEGVANHTSTSVTASLTTIVTQMMAKINLSHDQAEDEIKLMLEPFKECSGPVEKLGEELGGNAEDADKQNTKYVACLESEDAKKKAKDGCEELLETDEKLAETCDNDDDKNQANPCIPKETDTYPAWVRKMHNYFKEEMAKAAEAQKTCDEAKKKVEEKKPECKKYAEEHEKKKAECEQIRQGLINRVCADDTTHSETCKSSSECWKTKMEAYQVEKRHQEEREKMRKTEWRASKRIECLIQTFHKDEQNKLIDLCIQKRHNTDHLNLTFPDPPQPENCPDRNPVPCNEVWKTKYPQVVDKGCKECPVAERVMQADIVKR